MERPFKGMKPETPVPQLIDTRSLTRDITASWKPSFDLAPSNFNTSTVNDLYKPLVERAMDEEEKGIPEPEIPFCVESDEETKSLVSNTSVEFYPEMVSMHPPRLWL